jgi:steroid delta-isomerase-like uncharacterized protein
VSNGTSTEASKAIVARFIDEVCNAGRLEAIDDLFSPDVRVHHERNPDQDRYGRDALRAWLDEACTAFADQRTRIEQMFAENDRVMLHTRTEATHRGALGGVAPTGAAVAFTTTAIVRLHEDRIAEIWPISDTLGILQQIGAQPPLG